MVKETILLVEDEKNIFELVQYNLQKEGFRIIWAPDGQKGLDLFSEEKPDLVLLDLMLPGIDGIEVCRRIRARAGFSTPIIMLTARSDEIDKILGLEMGADDYITKPFSIRELIARIKVALRRTQPEESAEKISRGALELKPEEFSATYHGFKITLTPKEFSLLYLLCKHPGRVVTRENALQKVWGYEYYGDTRTVDVHIRQIRQKLEQIAPDDNPIETLRGIGYRWRG